MKAYKFDAKFSPVGKQAEIMYCLVLNLPDKLMGNLWAHTGTIGCIGLALYTL